MGTLSDQIRDVTSTLINLVVVAFVTIALYRVVSKFASAIESEVSVAYGKSPATTSYMRLFEKAPYMFLAAKATAPATGAGEGKVEGAGAWETKIRLTPSEAKALILNVFSDWYSKFFDAARRLGFYDALRTVPPPPSILLVGPPGVGKSAIVREVAEELARMVVTGTRYSRPVETLPVRKFIEYSEDIGERIVAGEISPSEIFVYHDFRLTEVEPADLLGVPHFVEIGKYFRYEPPLWVRVMSIPEIAGMLFLDELTNVSRDDVMAVAYKLFLDRRAGEVDLNKLVFIVSAGNPEQWSSIARLLPAPLANRLLIIRVDVRPDKKFVDEWAKWMDSRYGAAGWSRIVYGFLRQHPGSMVPPPIAETLEGYPSPRSWSMLSVYGKTALDEYVEARKIAETLRREIDRLRKAGKEAEAKEKEKEYSEILDKISKLESKIRNLAIGYVGDTSGTMFIEWLRKKILPYRVIAENPEELDKLSEAEMYVTASILAFDIVSLKTTGRLEGELPYIVKALDEIGKRRREVLSMILSMLPDDIRKEIREAMEKYSEEAAKTAKKASVEKLRTIARYYGFKV